MEMKNVRQLVDLLDDHDAARTAAHMIRSGYMNRVTIRISDIETDSGIDIYELNHDERKRFATYLTEKATSIYKILDSLEIKEPEKDDEN